MKRTARVLPLGLLALLLILASAPALAQQAQKHLTLEDIHGTGTFSPDGFQGGRWADEGPVITFIDRDRESGTTHLVSYNLETEVQMRLIDGTDLQADDVDRLIQIQNYTYSPDGRKVLLYTDSERVWRQNTKGYYYIYDLENGDLKPISSRDKGFQMFAKFSPDGKHVAFVRDRNLFVVDLASMDETQLTSDGAEGGIINGTSDWVYEEEFGLRDGFSWSPDSRYIAFLQLDETNTRDFAMTDLREFYPSYTKFRYPKAGTVNSEIHVGMIDFKTSDLTPKFFDTDTWYEGGDDHEYIPQMGWTPPIDGKYHVWMFRMDRDQNDLDILYGDPETLTAETVMQESEDTWIEVETGFSDLDVGQLTYLDDGAHFAWISERDGFRHLYLYENDGTFVRQLTTGDWDVTDFHGIDEQTGLLYFSATMESPLERHLYRLNINEAGATPEKITQRAGWHNINPSSDLKYYIDQYSNANTPPIISLHETDGDQLKLLEGNEDLQQLLTEYALPMTEFMEVPGADGTMLNAMLIKPSDFDPNRQYPLLMFVYGGPGSQTVRNSWGGSRALWHQYLAEEKDILVASVDNRGTGARGKAFKSTTYKRLGVLEAQDQIAAAQHLAERDYIDAARIGIWGWSYGGFMTMNAMLIGEGPETFSMGMSVAPVTDWRLYDTIYTERYMSTPQKNLEGYLEGSPQTYAKNLGDEQSLLIVHGDFDDNVHFQNTVQMVDKLQAAGKQFDMMMYPGRNHGIYGGNTRMHLYTYLTNYAVEHLQDTPEPVEIQGSTR